MKMDETKYWPRSIVDDDPSPNPVSLINQPPVAAVPLRPTQQRSLHAVLCEALIDTQALLARLESGVHVPEAGQRAVVRQLYVAARNQAKALIATLECEGLE